MTIHSTFGKLAFSLALAGTFLFPGLDARAANDTTDTLNFVNYRDVRDLNPHLYAGEMYAQEMIFETLVDITADGYKPCLAESWDISADGKVYTFHIRKGVTFTDGTVRCFCHQGQLRCHPGKPCPPYLAGDDAPAGKGGRA